MTEKTRSAEDYANVAVIGTLNKQEWPVGTSIKLTGLTRERVTVEISIPHKFQRVRENDPEPVFYDGEYAERLNALDDKLTAAISEDNDRKMRMGAEVYDQVVKIKKEVLKAGTLNEPLGERILEIVRKLLIEVFEVEPTQINTDGFLEEDGHA